MINIERKIKRIKARTVTNEKGCWLWQGGQTEKGYGLTYFEKGKYRAVHIVTYILIKGEYQIEGQEKLELDHLCRIRHCCNPDHLEPVTHQENIRRGETGIVNRSKTHCPKGHEYTSENTFRTKIGRQCRQCKRDDRSEWGKTNRDYRNAKKREYYRRQTAK